MNEQEKAELNKQKKLVDCVNSLNRVETALERFENDKAEMLSVIDGFDLTHCDTYLKLTENIRQELFMIKFFASSAADSLTEYHQLCNPDQRIYSIKERKRRTKHDLTSSIKWKLESEKIQPSLPESPLQSSQIPKKQEQQELITQRLAKIESRILRGERAILLLLLLQIGLFLIFSWKIFL
ncbi:MAG: hypothetical protein ACRDBG_24625 [Waterburya sp.]